MVKVSLDEKNWKSLVSTAANGISDIEDIKVSSIGKTTLTRFKTFGVKQFCPIEITTSYLYFSFIIFFPVIVNELYNVSFSTL